MIDLDPEFQEPSSANFGRGLSTLWLGEDLRHSVSGGISGERLNIPTEDQVGERLLRIEALNERLVERAAARRATILGALVA